MAVSDGAFEKKSEITRIKNPTDQPVLPEFSDLGNVDFVDVACEDGPGDGPGPDGPGSSHHAGS